jgi:ABC-type Fe2+-enterobactin transport system substrate-binding protein
MKRICLTIAGVICVSTASAQQYPMLDRVAERVVQKYQTSSCQELAVQRQHPPTGRREQAEQRVIQMLHQDPQMRQEFLNRVAAPIANKMFECGMIP